MPSLSPVHGAPPYAALAKGLSEAFAVLQKLGALAGELGEQSALASRFTLDVSSVAEVDGIAAELGARPGWDDLWTYSATVTGDTVTVTVTFTAVPPDGTAILGAGAGMTPGCPA